MFVVFHRDRPIARAENDRATHLGVLDVFAIDSTLGGAPILQFRDVRDGGLEHTDRIAGHVTAATAADQVGADAQPGALRGNRAVAAQRSVRFSHTGSEVDFAGDGVEHEVVVVRLALDEVLHLLPLLPAVDVAHLEDRARTARHDRPALERVPLPGDAFGHPQELVLHQLGIHGLGGAANRECAQAFDGR